MTIFPRRIFLLAAVVLMPTLALASPQQPNLVDAVGLAQHLDLLYRSYQRRGEEGLAGAARDAETAFFTRWKSATAAFAPEKVRARIGAVLDEKLADADRATVAAFYGSELGRKISAIEARENNLESQTRFMFKMMFKPDTIMKRASQAPERMELCEKLNAALDKRDFGTLIAAHSGVANQLVRVSGGQSIGKAALQKMIDAKVAEKTASKSSGGGLMGSVQVLQQFSAYRELDTAELKKYMAFLQTPAAQRFNAAIYASVNQALSETAMDFHRGLAVPATAP